MKKLLLASLFVFGSGIPDSWVIQNLTDLSDAAYLDRSEAFIASLKCTPVISDKKEWGIICDTPYGLEYRKDN